MVKIDRATETEWQEAKKNGKSKMAVINNCRREGYTHAGHFVYSVPYTYFKTTEVDRFIELGGANDNS